MSSLVCKMQVEHPLSHFFQFVAVMKPDFLGYKETKLNVQTSKKKKRKATDASFVPALYE